MFAGKGGTVNTGVHIKKCSTIAEADFPRFASSARPRGGCIEMSSGGLFSNAVHFFICSPEEASKWNPHAW